MKKSVFFVLLLAVLTSTIAEVKMVGYIPEYRVSQMDKMNLSSLSYVVAAFANPDSVGTMSCPIDLNAFSEKVLASGSKPVISIGGGGDYSWGDKASIYHYLYNDSNRTGFVKKIADYCEKYKCSGIDSDIEGLALSNMGYDAFLSELADTLHARGLKIFGTYGVGGNWGAINVSDSTLLKLDMVSTMSYGGVDKWNWSKPSNQASFERFKSDMEYFINRGVKPSKICGGIPFYSYGYPPNSVSNFSPYYHTIQQLVSDSLYSSQNAFYYDTLVNSEGLPEFFSGFRTNKLKIDLCVTLGSGIMIWELGQDNYSGNGPRMLDSMATYIATTTAVTVTSNKSNLNRVTIHSMNGIIWIRVPVAGLYDVKITNLKGSTVRILDKLSLQRGVNMLSPRTANIGNGLYILSLRNNFYQLFNMRFILQ